MDHVWAQDTATSAARRGPPRGKRSAHKDHWMSFKVDFGSAALAGERRANLSFCLSLEVHCAGGRGSKVLRGLVGTDTEVSQATSADHILARVRINCIGVNDKRRNNTDIGHNFISTAQLATRLHVSSSLH